MQIVASVIGLAPIRPGLKDRLLELLCIHGRNTAIIHEKRSCRSLAKTPRLLPPPGNVKTKWSPRLVSRQRLLLFREALICLSYSGRSSPSLDWLSRAVTLRGLPVISRVLCY